MRDIVRAMRELGVDEYTSADRDTGELVAFSIKLGPAPSRLMQIEERIANASEPEQAAVAIGELKEEKAKQAEDLEREELEAMLASSPHAGNQELISSLMTPRSNGTPQ